MICGTYGMRDGDIIVAKTSSSAPFNVEEAKGRNLIALGYAQEVKDVVPDAKEGNALNAEDNLTDYSLQDLRKLAKKMGLAATGSKQQLLERILASKSDILEESQEDEAAPIQSDEEPPILTPAEPET